jgi:hypothetical protein
VTAASAVSPLYCRPPVVLAAASVRCCAPLLLLVLLVLLFCAAAAVTALSTAGVTAESDKERYAPTPPLQAGASHHGQLVTLFVSVVRHSAVMVVVHADGECTVSRVQNWQCV